MISRRTFVATSLAASAAGLAACRENTAPASTPAEPRAEPKGKARLTLHFAGGSAFKHNDKKLWAIQLSGLDKQGKPVTFQRDGHDHQMEHRSFMVFPPETFKKTDYAPFPETYDTAVLNGRITPGWQPVCIVGSDIEIVPSAEQQFSYLCQQVAHYGKPGHWTKSWDWETGAVGGPVNSRFTIYGGFLSDSPAHNVNAWRQPWKLKTVEKHLSDIATLTLVSDQITIKNLPKGELKLEGKLKHLEVFVFAGPVNTKGEEGKEYTYSAISHAALLSTIYDNTKPDELLPTTAYPITEIVGTKQKHPCDLNRGEPFVLAPPDSEYCINYDELP